VTRGNWYKPKTAKLDARNPSAIHKLIKDKLKFDDKSKISKLKEVLATAKTDYAELFTYAELLTGKPQGSIDASAGKNQLGAGVSMNDFIRRQARK
jgi:hypothetical protein